MIGATMERRHKCSMPCTFPQGGWAQRGRLLLIASIASFHALAAPAAEGPIQEAEAALRRAWRSDAVSAKHPWPAVKLLARGGQLQQQCPEATRKSPESRALHCLSSKTIFLDQSLKRKFCSFSELKKKTTIYLSKYSIIIYYNIYRYNKIKINIM